MSPALREGLRAYALSHAEAERALARRWTTKWSTVRQKAMKFLADTDLQAMCDLYASSDALAADVLMEDDPSTPYTVQLDVEDIFEDEDEYD